MIKFKKTKNNSPEILTYEVLNNETLIATVDAWINSTEECRNLCECEMGQGEKSSLFDFISSTKLVEKEAHSFLFVSNLKLCVSSEEFFKETPQKLTSYVKEMAQELGIPLKELPKGRIQKTVQDFMFGLESLRKELQVDICYIAFPKTEEVQSNWSLILERWGFSAIATTPLCHYYVSKVHLCETCSEWIPIKETHCATCDYEQRTF